LFWMCFGDLERFGLMLWNWELFWVGFEGYTG
jgi:hypothetical protein